MSASFLSALKSGPPPPRVVLLPDQRFFVRIIPVSPTAQADEVASAVELALEGISPFPPSHLFYGHFWVPGSDRALVYSCYRKRFTTEEHAEWERAVLVVPTFAALLGQKPEPATAIVVPTADGLTMIYWSEGAVPSLVRHVSLSPEADDTTWAQAREQLLKASGGCREVIDLTETPTVVVSPDEKHFEFRAGEFATRLPVAGSKNLDVRDPEELRVYRSGQRRDLWLWRAASGSVAALFLLGALELGLKFGGGLWNEALAAKISAQTPSVTDIEAKRALAESVENRVQRRLLPLEMASVVMNRDIPEVGSIIFTTATASINAGLYVLNLSGDAANAGEFDLYRQAIARLEPVESVQVVDQRVNQRTTFQLLISFFPDALQPAAAPSP